MAADVSDPTGGGKVLLSVLKVLFRREKPLEIFSSPFIVETWVTCPLLNQPCQQEMKLASSWSTGPSLDEICTSRVLTVGMWHGLLLLLTERQQLLGHGAFEKGSPTLLKSWAVTPGWIKQRNPSASEVHVLCRATQQGWPLFADAGVDVERREHFYTAGGTAN
ncbi:uncharacterized protein LOC128597362 [Nycticebus coucang]|uniref:uncharacterized protein LOC128597362 n=1 Tax=Nycticebus coucang TaxID=9470 RepID=UPI00234D4345|nr:uncharacterized protein LOC128597362 [Nycticebus coucang]